MSEVCACVCVHVCVLFCAPIALNCRVQTQTETSEPLRIKLVLLCIFLPIGKSGNIVMSWPPYHICPTSDFPCVCFLHLNTLNK